MEIKDFIVFILTHGRPDNVITYKSLRRHGYTGKVYLIIDNEDDKAGEYYKNYPGEVIMFDKLVVSKEFDEMDNFNDRRAIVYARNACFGIAKELGYTYFLELDDDYTSFDYRTDGELTYGEHQLGIKNIDAIFKSMLNFYKKIPAKSIAMAQGGDFIGGSENGFAKDIKLRRKCMNSFFCSTERVFKFVGRINEDVNTYTHAASIGDLFFTVPIVSLTQKSTQSNSGGMTDIYLDNGTYIKSFYTVMLSPSSVKISMMGDKHRRLHHMVAWNNAIPVILNQKYKKTA